MRGTFKYVRVWWILLACGNALSIRLLRLGSMFPAIAAALCRDPGVHLPLVLWQERDPRDQARGLWLACTPVSTDTEVNTPWHAEGAHSSILILKIAYVPLPSIYLDCFYKDSRLINLKCVMSVLAIRDFWFSIQLFLEKLTRYSDCPYRRRWTRRVWDVGSFSVIQKVILLCVFTDHYPWSTYSKIDKVDLFHRRKLLSVSCIWNTIILIVVVNVMWFNWYVGLFYFLSCVYMYVYVTAMSVGTQGGRREYWIP